jgi:catechol 2,3-dioxygenase-like lactoylglutathione lyase family enzyme
MLRLHHISLKTKNIDNLKNFYVYLFNVKVVHKFENNKNVYGYFLLLGKNNFIEILSYRKREIVNHKKNSSLNHFCILADKEYKQILSKCKKNKILTEDEKRGRTDNTLHFKFFDPDKNLCEIHYNDNKTILKDYNKL